MPNYVSDTRLSQLSDFVAAQMGLHFPRQCWRDLERRISSAARELDFKDTESCIDWFLSASLTRSQVESLASHLTVGETYFFRERKSLEILEDHILPALIHSRRQTDRRLRIWSAGCATGEEPYSIAIVLSKVVSDLQDWNITILATDINPRFLQKASAGVYGGWSFRDTPPWVREGYFKRTNAGRLEILPQIKKMVMFSYLNLAEDAYPSLWNHTNAMDVIFCRNVLMYFAPEKATKVVQNLYRSLVEGGWLIVGPVEVSHSLFSQFVTCNFPGAILYRKHDHRPHGADVFPFLLDQESTPSLPPLPALMAEPAPEVSLLSNPGELPGPAAEEPKMVAEQPTPYREALSLYEQGQYVRAAEKLMAALSENPTAAGAMALLARVYANQGRLVEARAWCEKAIAAAKLNAGHHYLLALILQEQGAWEEAKCELRRAVYLDQDFALAHVALGNLNQRQGEVRKSRKHFENALSLLRRHGHEDPLPESEGITAGRLAEILGSMSRSEKFL